MRRATLSEVRRATSSSLHRRRVGVVAAAGETAEIGIGQRGQEQCGQGHARHLSPARPRLAQVSLRHGCDLGDRRPLVGRARQVAATGAGAREAPPKQVLMPEDAGARAFQEEVGYSEAVIHGDTIYLSGVVAGPREGEDTSNRDRRRP